MKKGLITLISLTLLLPLPAGAQTREKENTTTPSVREEQARADRQTRKKGKKDFWRTLKDLPEEQRLQALIEEKNQRHEKKARQTERIHQQKIQALKDKLASHDRLSEEQKQRLLAHRVNQYQEQRNYKNTRHAQSIAFLQELDAEPDLSFEQKKIILKEHRQGYRRKTKDALSQGREMPRAYRGRKQKD